MRFRVLTAVALVVAAVQGCTPGSVSGDTNEDEAQVVAADAPVVKLAIDLNDLGKPVSREQAGTNEIWNHNANGAWRGTTYDADLAQQVNEVGVGLLRYPGGTLANLFDFTHAVGAQRGCQVVANFQSGADGLPTVHTSSPPESSTPYGPAEHMDFARASGARINIQIPFITGSARRAAAFVQYLNSDAGVRVIDGRDWAAVRANEDGHPKPFGVHYFEIGNEVQHKVERYWMDTADNDHALRQYIQGDHSTVRRDEPLGQDCDFTAAALTNGQPGQQLQILYPPVSAVKLTVGTETWVGKASIADAGATDKVFQFDGESGVVRFGDGVHGQIPPSGKAPLATYTLDHDGFLDMVAAMKKVDPSIQVCSAWGRTDFVDRMGSREYDCVIAHPYTNYEKPTDTLADLWAVHMSGEDGEGAELSDLVHDVRQNRGGGSFVGVSEFGFITHATQPTDDFAQTLMHGLYMGSVMTRILGQDIPFGQGGPLTDPAPRAVFTRDAKEWIPSAHALVLETFSSMLAHGGRTVSQTISDQVVVKADAGNYDAVVSAVTHEADGTLNVFAVNRALGRDVQLDLDVSPFKGDGSGEAWRVSASDGNAFGENTAANPDEVRIHKASVSAHGKLRYGLPQHSVLWLRLASGKH